MATISRSGERSKYDNVFESQSFGDFIRQANIIAKCNEKLIWEKKSLEPVVDKKIKRLSLDYITKYITNIEESSRVAKSWAHVLPNTLKDTKLTDKEISLFRRVQKTFRLLAWKCKNGAKDNYTEATASLQLIFDAWEYRQEEQQEGEQLRIRAMAKIAQKKLVRMSLDESSSSAESGEDELEDVGNEEDVGVEGSEEDRLKADGLKLSQNKCSNLTKSICSVSVVAAGVLLTMLYKYNE